MPENLIGALLDQQYQMLTLLAEGPVAAVYGGRQATMEREVAIKVYARELSRRRAVERFYREAGRIARLEHIAIAPLYAFGEHEGYAYVVSRYFEGGSLADMLLHEGALPPGNAARVTRQVAGALAYAHEQGVVHRNVKPSNILFDSTGTAYLSDFALETLDVPTVPLPEAGTGAASEPTADVYALGVATYEMLAGRPAYSAPDAEALADLHRSAQVPTPTDVNADIPPIVSAVVVKAMSKQPAERFQTPMGLATELHRVIDEVGLGEVRPFQTLAPDTGEAAVAGAEATVQLDVQPDMPGSDAEATIAPSPRAQPAVAPARPRARRRNPLLVVGGIVAGVLIVGGAILGLTGGLNRSAGEAEAEQPAVNATVAEPPTPVPATLTPELPTSTPLPPSPTVVPTVQATIDAEAAAAAVTPTITLDLADLPAEIHQYGVPMVLVPAGTFVMGDEALPDQRPVHEVTLDTFYIDKFEVTNAEYKLCEDDGICDPQDETTAPLIFGYYGTDFYANYPAIYMSWETAVQYCEWREARLPTEAEWEKAARWDPETGETYRYPWGNAFPTADLVNYRNAGPARPEAVDSYPEGVSPVGAYNMSGNVLEWVNDWYDADYYDVSPAENPQGPETGELKVLRSSSFNHSSGAVIPTTRWAFSFTFTADDFGFRCALTPGEGGGLTE